MAKRATGDDISKSHDFRGFLNEFDAETDRAAAILAAAFLGEHLKELTTGFLIDDSTEVDKLLGVNCPLGSFATRISAAYCLGLISKDEFHDLGIIREIRNRFAHRLHGLDFSDSWVKDKCGALRLPKTAPHWPLHTGARNSFTVAAAVLLFALVGRTGQVRSERRAVPNNFKLHSSVD